MDSKPNGGMKQSLLHRTGNVGIATGSVALVLMMLVGVGDIVARHLGYSIAGAHEIIKMLMVLVVFLALPAVEVDERHIYIDLVRRRLPCIVRGILVGVSKILSLLFFGAMAWQAWKLFGRSWRFQEYASGFIPLPVYPVKLIYALGITVAALFALVGLLWLLARAVHGPLKR